MTNRPTLLRRALGRLRHQVHANPYYQAQQKSDTRRRLFLFLAATTTSGVLLCGVGLTLLERQRIQDIRLEGVQFLEEGSLRQQIEEALNERSFLGVQRWYSTTIQPSDIVRHMAKGEVEVTEVRREGRVLVVGIRETVVQIAQQQADGWHLLGPDGTSIGIAAEPPADVPRVQGPLRPEALHFVITMNDILRRNNETLITELQCDKESNGSWCQTNIRNKTILFDYRSEAEHTWDILQNLWQRPEQTIDLRFGQRIYLR